MMPIRMDLLCESQEQDDNISLGIEKLVALVVIILAGIISAIFIFPIEMIFKKKTKEACKVGRADTGEETDRTDTDFHQQS